MAKNITKTPLLGEKVRVSIERLAYGGDGVARHEGKVIFVPFSVPGDELDVEVIEDHPRFSRAKILDVVKVSKDRIDAPCPVFGQCGGCQWQNMHYKKQAEHKENIFRETLRHLGGMNDLLIEPLIAAEQIWEYRRRIQIKVNGAGQVGFFGRSSHDLVPVLECLIAHPQLNAYLKDKKIREDSELRWDENLQELHTYPQSASRFLFEQAHVEQNQHLLKLVAEYAELKPHYRVLELYAGQGNFGLSLSAQVSHWLGVDQSAESIGIAEREKRAKNLKGIEFMVGSADWGLKRALRKGYAAELLILDPPREGAKDILDLISVLNAHRIVYISCNPSSLARDLKFLVQKGYRVEKTRPLDMFPQTYHIESVTQLVHGD
jgi:23S rRNA (uracil1939-C5)-methyltransferase